MKGLKDIAFYYDSIPVGTHATTERLPRLAEGRVFKKEGRIRLGSNRVQIDSMLLYDADRLAKAALVSYLASSWLRSGAHSTWSEIALYYCYFHTVGALLRLAGFAPIRCETSKPKGLLLVRIDETSREYVLIHTGDPLAREIGVESSGSHRGLLRLYAVNFLQWHDEIPRREAESLAERDFGEAGYELVSGLRNSANYLQRTAGTFFPESDITGLHEFQVEMARIRGNWDWLRTDDVPEGLGGPPEAEFTFEQLYWQLLKYTLQALLAAEGSTRLVDHYEWITNNVDAYPDLKRHVLEEITALRN